MLFGRDDAAQGLGSGHGRRALARRDRLRQRRRWHRREVREGAAGEEWKVGVYLSLSGEDTAFGQYTKEGIELAVDEINKAGGVKGKPIKVLYEDDKSNPQEASNKVLQLIDRDKVVAILGEVASSRSPAPAASSRTRRRRR